MVLDDLMEEGSNDKRVLDLFTKHSHHQNVTVIYLCQDMFPWANMPKAFPIMPITSWPSRARGINWGYAMCCFNRFPPVGKTVWKPFITPSLWVFGVGFVPGFVRPTTIVEPHLKRRGMDTSGSKASPSDTGC